MSDPADTANCTGPIVLGREASFALGPLSVDPPRLCVVSAGGRELTLEPRVMQVLVALAKSYGATVTRDELMRDCWPGVVVGEDSLHRAVGRLRRLMDEAGGGLVLETIPRVGYRLKERSPGPVLERNPADERPLIVVLPFANLSDDPRQDYFSDGISEDIMTDLSRISALGVVARNTAFSLKGANLPIDEVVRRLGVSHVLEGSVRKAGNRVRISAQLVDGAAGHHIWAERWDRELRDIFALQDEISRAIVSALKVRLSPGGRSTIESRGTASHEAYDLYLMARDSMVTGNIGDPRVEEAIVRLCRRATAIDPRYARAWGAMAWAQCRLAIDRCRGGDDGLEAAKKAEALDPDLGAPHAVRAAILYRDGRVGEALAESVRAVELEPDAHEVTKTVSRILYNERRFPEAERLLVKAAASNRSDFGATGVLIGVRRMMNDAEGARDAARMTLERAEALLANDAYNGFAMGFGTLALVELGEVERAREWIEHGLLADPDNAQMLFNMACGLAQDQTDVDQAIELLKMALDSDQGPSLARLAAVNPGIDPLRGDPRLAAIVNDARSRAVGPNVTST